MKLAFPPLSVVSAALLTGACQTVPDSAAQPVLENFADHNIVVATSRSGKLGQRGACLTFNTDNATFASQFAAGTRYDAQARAVLLPNGDRLALGRTMTLRFEGPPGSRSSVADCAGLEAIQIIGKK